MASDLFRGIVDGVCVKCKALKDKDRFCLCQTCFKELKVKCDSCASCGGELLKGGKLFLCESCDKAFRYLKKYPFVSGRCFICKSKPPAPYSVFCDECTLLNRSSSKCLSCNKYDKNPGMDLCEYCERCYLIEKHSSFVVGKCACCCLKPSVLGYTLCQECFIFWKRCPDICPVCCRPRGKSGRRLCADCEMRYHRTNNLQFVYGMCVKCKEERLAIPPSPLCSRCFHRCELESDKCPLCKCDKEKTQYLCPRCKQRWEAYNSLIFSFDRLIDHVSQSIDACLQGNFETVVSYPPYFPAGTYDPSLLPPVFFQEADKIIKFIDTALGEK